MEHRAFKSKILLFGEYTVILGSRALAAPFNLYYGFWEKVALRDEAEIASNQSLSMFFQYLSALENSGKFGKILDLKQLEKDIEEGLIFNSTIPSGYGLGSSGALCAAVYQTYCRVETYTEIPMDKLRSMFALMENHFHGSSSGLDPLISYKERPILVGTDKGLHTTTLDWKKLLPIRPFLLDTGISRQTSPLVGHFMERLEDEDYKIAIETKLLEYNDQAIDALISGNAESFTDAFRKISEFQFKYFKRMIPEQIIPVWEKGLESDLYFLKLCGAGGGGVMLGLNRSSEIPDELNGFPTIALTGKKEEAAG